MKASTEFESPVLDVIKMRRSQRAYSDRPIESEKIRSLFEAARWAPSSRNDQPWTYIYATKDQPDFWTRLFALLNPSNQVWAKDAPLLVLSLARKNFATNGRSNDSAKYDLGAANAFVALQATELGLNLHQMGGYDHQKAIDDLKIPDTYELGVMMAVGYHGDPSKLSLDLQQRELGPRYRYIQDDFVMNKTF
jgi:nitroreductase